MDYQAPAPAAGGRGCYNCKKPIILHQARNTRIETFPTSVQQFGGLDGRMLRTISAHLFENFV